jgi:hypothetical protein
MELLQRRMSKSFSLRQDLLVRLENEVPDRSMSRWVEGVLLSALDRQNKKNPGSRNEKTQHP